MQPPDPPQGTDPQPQLKPQRVGMVIALHPDRVAEYRDLHARPRQAVNDAMRRNGWSDFTIFLKEPENLLFGTFLFHGTDLAASQARIAADPATIEWLRLTDPCQKPLDTRRPGEWWALMETVFYMD